MSLLRKATEPRRTGKACHESFVYINVLFRLKIELENIEKDKEMANDKE